MELADKLAILADAAKYDASCASSGAKGRKSDAGGGIGSTTGNGICHSYTPDGRCVSLLKILLTNFCTYDCQYCINRRSSDVQRARFTVDEVVALTLDFYRRNYIEGLFLSSGIVQSADHTMEQLILVAKKLRLEHDYRGYIHLKTIPEADAALIAEAGRWADRLSVNIELPTEQALETLAPEKRVHTIKLAMGRIRTGKEEAEDPARPFAPAGQSTQLIVGADDSDDRRILGLSESLYGAYKLKRVYYSAYSPIPKPSATLPAAPPPLRREHRLYQADWLMRYYGFSAGEILPAEGDGVLPLDIDPKLAWALAHRDRFPLDVNVAAREDLLRVPGLGVRNVDRILATRRRRRLRYADLSRLRCDLKKARAFLITADYHPHVEPSSARLARRAAVQLPLI
ncbi:MAG TPA: putative DNA modification/repair radical SAM protein [Usitatibacter sp.]|nr:putative DNA modification/repair radical SAM protein [Usitatibacter sp.]